MLDSLARRYAQFIDWLVFSEADRPRAKAAKPRTMSAGDVDTLVICRTESGGYVLSGADCDGGEPSTVYNFASFTGAAPLLAHLYGELIEARAR